MRVAGVMLLATALASALYAFVYQCRDVVATRGGTMGAEMTAGLIWLIAAILCSIGSLLLSGWCLSVVALAGTLALSFLIRASIPKVLRRRAGR